MTAKVFALFALVSVVKAGYLTNNHVQVQSNSYANAISHPPPAPAPAPAPHPVIYDHVPSVATSSVHVATATADSGQVVVSQAAPAPLLHSAPAPVIESAHAPVIHAAPAVIQTRVEPYDPNPHYTYGYDINDPHTGDSKNQQETRTGDVVHGHYSLTDPDGSRRTVDYSAGPHTGFNAVVRRTGLHPAPAVSHPTYVGH